MMRRHKYQFVSETKRQLGLYNYLTRIVTLRHSRYGEQDWILRETFYKRQCDGTGKPIERGQECYSLLHYDASRNRKARLSIEFIEQLKANPEEAQ